MQAFDHISIEALNLSKRTYHALVRSGVLTIGSLRQFYLKRSAIQIRMIGEKSLNEISKALEELHKNPTLSALIEKVPIQLQLHNPEEKQIETTNQSSIDVLNLTAAIRGMLKKHGIKTVNDLRNAPDSMLLNINLIGPKKLAEIKHSLTNFVANSDMSVVNKPIPVAEKQIVTDPPVINKPMLITEKKTITWSQIIENYFRSEKDIHTYILISRFGYTSKTLEEIATELNVTRERVRQIQMSVATRFLNYARYNGALGLINKIEEIFGTKGDELSLSSFEIILVKQGILGQLSETITTKYIEKIDLLETLICWLKLLSDKRYRFPPREFSVDIFDLVQSKNISIKDHVALMQISKKEQRKIKRKVLFTGGITIKEAVKIISKDERITVSLLKNLNLQKVDKEWFSFKNLDENSDNNKIPLRIAGLKMLAINPEIEISEFHDGLRRHASRLYTSIAPIHVISHALPILGFEINNSKVTTHLSKKGILSQSENALISAISKNEGVASFLEIAEEFFLWNRSLPSVSKALKQSPIVKKIDEGLYKLRGSDISWQQIEDAKKRQKRFSQDNEVSHGLDGVVRMKFTVSKYAYLSGVVGAYNIKEMSGSWSVVHDGKVFGEAKIDYVYLWGLAKLFKKLDIKMGERIELALNTWNRTLSVRKVNHENS